MVAAMLRTNENDNAPIGLRTTDLRNIAIGLAAAIALIMVAGQIHDSGSASASALEDTKDSRFTCSFTSANTASPNEAQTDAQTVTATASGGGNTCTFTNTGGADTADFTISAAGDLNFAATPDHENPVDSDTDNEYVVIITATDSADSATTTQTITITVQDVTLAITDKTVAVSETAADDAAVTTPTIADVPDTCQITSGNSDADNDGTNLFAITSACVITIDDSGDLDYEATTSYSLTLPATDTDVNNGANSDSAVGTVTVNIQDVAPTVTDNDVNYCLLYTSPSPRDS